MNTTSELMNQQPELDWLHARYVSGERDTGQKEVIQYENKIETVIEALSYISPDEYSTWIEVGMALKAGGISKESWDDWSSHSTKYVSDEIGPKWASFKSEGLTLGTVFYLAKQRGYKHQSPASEDESVRQSQATKLLKIIEEEQLRGTVEIFMTPAEETFASFPIKGIQQTMPLASASFRTFLRQSFKDKCKTLCGSEAIGTVVEYLSGQITKTEQVFVRIAHTEGAIYVDLADETRQVVEISAAGWKIIEANICPVKFWRPRGLLPLPVPITGGDMNFLRRVMNISTDDHYYRALSFLIGSFVNGPLLVLSIVGEKGSAKTMQARLLKRILDPNEADIMSDPETDRDLLLACKNQHCVVIDNLSRLTQGRSDIHCRISTGAAVRERALYSNGDEFIYKLRRPQIFTSIKDVVKKSDLADRKLKIELASIPKEGRKTEEEIWTIFEPQLSRLLGALYDAVSGALKELPNVKTSKLPRMADAAKFLLAAENFLHWPSGTVEGIFADEAQSDAEDIVDTDPFATALLETLQEKGGHWQDTSKAILEALEPKKPSGSYAWPRSGRGVAGRLRELAPDLRQLGVEYNKETGGQRRYTFEYSKVPDVPQAPQATLDD